MSRGNTWDDNGISESDRKIAQNIVDGKYDRPYDNSLGRSDTYRETIEGDRWLHKMNEYNGHYLGCNCGACLIDR